MEDPDIMADVITWADDSQDKWAVLLDAVRSRYTPTPPMSLTNLTPREILLRWVGNRYNYYRGLAEGNSADVSFWGRAVARVENYVPAALSTDSRMAQALLLKTMAGKKANVNSETIEMAMEATERGQIDEPGTGGDRSINCDQEGGV